VSLVYNSVRSNSSFRITAGGSWRTCPRSITSRTWVAMSRRIAYNSCRRSMTSACISGVSKLSTMDGASRWACRGPNAVRATVIKFSGCSTGLLNIRGDDSPVGGGTSSKPTPAMAPSIEEVLGAVLELEPPYDGSTSTGRGPTPPGPEACGRLPPTADRAVPLGTPLTVGTMACGHGHADPTLDRPRPVTSRG